MASLELTIRDKSDTLLSGVDVKLFDNSDVQQSSDVTGIDGIANLTKVLAETNRILITKSGYQDLQHRFDGDDVDSYWPFFMEPQILEFVGKGLLHTNTAPEKPENDILS